MDESDVSDISDVSDVSDVSILLCYWKEGNAQLKCIICLRVADALLVHGGQKLKNSAYMVA